MKTQFLSYGGGLITGLLLVALLSAFKEKLDPAGQAPIPTAVALPEYATRQGFVEVPIKDFFMDVARYKTTHADVIEGTMEPRRKPSRMFIYSIDVLEDFFDVIRKSGKKAKIKSENLAIRFYYGIYPRGTKIAGEDYSGLHTLFMVPNHWSEQDSSFRDFEITKLAEFVKSNGYGKKNKQDVIAEFYLENIHKRDSSAGAFILDASAVRYTGPFPVKTASVFPMPAAPRVINQGQLCPPNCPLTSLLTYIDDTFPNEGF